MKGLRSGYFERGVTRWMIQPSCVWSLSTISNQIWNLIHFSGLSPIWLPLCCWWAPKMDNYLGSFNLLIRLNPPFSLVYWMFLIIFMLIEWIRLVIMPTSLMCALCSLFGQFGDKIKGFNEHLAAKFMGEKGWEFVGRCPLHLWALTSNYPPSAQSSRATKSISTRAAKQVK